MNGVRYDRQIRLWGEEGQSSIEHANVCVLGSSSLGAEILKSLILPGVGRFCVIDDAIIDDIDRGRNFFLTQNDCGKQRALVLTKYLLELNPSVKGNYIIEDCSNLSHGTYTSLLNFSIVISTCLTENAALKLSEYLYSNNVYFIYTRVCGLFGYIRLSFRHHLVWNMHAENQPHDFGLEAPFNELLALANLENLDLMTHERHSHTPYLLLYIKSLEKWRSEKAHEVSDTKTLLPNTYQKRKEFERVLYSMRKGDEKGSLAEENFEEAKRNILKSFPLQKIPENLQSMLNDIRTGSVQFLNNLDFFYKSDKLSFNIDLMQPLWIFTTAIKRFMQAHDNCLPLSGILPDMFSDSERYLKIQTIYKNKAIEHAKEIYEMAKEIYNERREFLSSNCIKNIDLKKNGNDKMDVDSVIDNDNKIENFDNYLSWAQCQEFCKNVRQISVQYGSSLANEFAPGIEFILKKVTPIKIQNEELDNEQKPFEVDPLVWFILMKATDRFYYEKNRFPGTNGVPCTIDSKDLKRRLMDLVNETKNKELIQNIENLIPNEAINEICRYGAAEPHVITAIIGGVVAQEAIKLFTHQYVPLDNALIYDGHSQNATTFRIY